MSFKAEDAEFPVLPNGTRVIIKADIGQIATDYNGSEGVITSITRWSMRSYTVAITNLVWKGKNYHRVASTLPVFLGEVEEIKEEQTA